MKGQILAVGVVAVLAPGILAQSLGEVAKRSAEKRTTASPSTLVFDARDTNPALAEEELLQLQLGPRRWQAFLAADGAVARVLAGDASFKARLEKSAGSVRALERTLQLHRDLVEAIVEAGSTPHDYAYTHLTIGLAAGQQGNAANLAFLKTRQKDLASLAFASPRIALGVSRAGIGAARTTKGSAYGDGGAETPRGEVAGGRIDTSMGVTIPDFAFVDFDGRNRSLSEFRGKYVLLDFWGSWCGPCRNEVPYAKATYAKYQSRGFEILALDYEQGATEAQVRTYLSSNGVTWPFATAASVRELITGRFQVQSFPTLILLDPDGVVIEAQTSALRGARLEQTLQKYLGR